MLNLEHCQRFSPLRKCDMLPAGSKYVQNLISYNHFHSILRLFDVLPNFPFKRIGLKQDKHDIFFLEVEIKDYNVKIDGKNVFDQPVKML